MEKVPHVEPKMHFPPTEVTKDLLHAQHLTEGFNETSKHVFKAALRIYSYIIVYSSELFFLRRKKTLVLSFLDFT